MEQMTANQYYTDANILSRSPAYCKGFCDGYFEGVKNNPYDGGSFNQNELENHLLYKIGYDAGVAEYCNETHPEE